MSKPVSGTSEWAASGHNIQTGCGHGCLYCYAHAMASRFDRVPEGGWTCEVLNPVGMAKVFGQRKGTIMFPTAHDITPANLTESTEVLERMLKPGNHVLIVSKPHLACISHLCRELAPYKDQILFRFTIGSALDGTLGFWEPGAPTFRERMLSLVYAHAQGFKTSVSMEPMLDTEEMLIRACVQQVEPFVTDSIWLGKVNKLETRLRANGHWEIPGVADMARALVASQSDERIHSLYAALKDNPKVKWKESIKVVVGLEVPTEAGLDV